MSELLKCGFCGDDFDPEVTGHAFYCSDECEDDDNCDDDDEEDGL
jgi:hypothetical protein